MADTDQPTPAADADQGPRPDQDKPDTPPAAEQPGDIRDPEAYWKAHFEKQNRLEKKEMAERLAAFEQAEEARKRKEQEAQGEFQDIIKDLEPKAKRAEELEKIAGEILDQEMQSIPEQFHGLIPDGAIEFRLQWVANAKAQGLFDKPRAPETDAGVRGDAVKPIKLTPEQRDMAKRLNMTDEEYAKNIRTP